VVGGEEKKGGTEEVGGGGGEKIGPSSREVRERIKPFSFLFSHLFSNHLKGFKNHFEFKETSVNKTYEAAWMHNMCLNLILTFNSIKIHFLLHFSAHKQLIKSFYPIWKDEIFWVLHIHRPRSTHTHPLTLSLFSKTSSPRSECTTTERGRN
jgi:hypothetical protein